MAEDRERGAYEFGPNQQAHVGVIVAGILLLLIFQATSSMSGISRVEMARLGTASASGPLPSAAPEAGDELTAGGTSLLPLSEVAAADGSIAAFVGQSAIGRGVPVLSVPADEGFWVGWSSTDRVWVQLTGSGESPYTVRPGDRAYFLGTVVGHSASYARTACAGDEPAIALLTAQGAHIEVPQDQLDLNR